MYLKRKSALLFVMIFLSKIIFAQENNTIDSLYKIILEPEAQCRVPCPSDTLIMGAYIKIGDILYMNNPDSALNIFAAAEDLAVKLMKSNPSKSIKNTALWHLSDALYYIGFINKKKGDLLKALDYYKKSLEIDKKLSNRIGESATYHNMGALYESQMDISNAIKSYNKSLKIKEELDDQLGIGYSLNAFGKLYTNQGDNNKALQFFQKSLLIFEKFDKKVEMALVINNIGSVYEIVGPRIKALEFYEKSLKISQEVMNKGGEALCLNNIGAYYSSIGKQNQAIDYYENSLKISQEIGDVKSIALTLFNISEIKLERGQSIRQEANKIYGVGKELGVPLVIEKGAFLMKVLKQNEGDFKKAFYYYQEEVLMRDSILDGENYKLVQKQQARYEYKQQAAIDSVSHFDEIVLKDQVLLKEREQNKLKTIIYWIASIFFAVLSFLIIYFQKIKIKRNYRLNEQQGVIHRISLKNKELENNALIAELDYKSKEVVNFALHIIEKNKFLENLRKEIIDFDEIADKKKLKKLIDENLFIEKDREEFKANIESINESFFLKLNDKFPKLTKNDKRLCSLLRLKLTSKEIATIQNISPSSVDITRHRLRKKLNITADVNLSDFLNKIL